MSKEDEPQKLSLQQTMLSVSLMASRWELHRAEQQGFANPGARMPQVRDAVIDVVGWDAGHDCVVEVLNEASGHRR